VSKSNSKTPAKKPKRKMNLSDAERKRRSEAAKKRIAEGKIGGQFGKLGGRPRKNRASDHVADAAEKNKAKMVSALEDALEDDQSISTRLKAVEQWLAIEDKNRRLEMDEEEHFAKMSREELAEHLAARFANNPVLIKIITGMIIPNGNGNGSGSDVIEGNGRVLSDGSDEDD
jgi:hypothetical protein